MVGLGQRGVRSVPLGHRDAAGPRAAAHGSAFVSFKTPDGEAQGFDAPLAQPKRFLSAAEGAGDHDEELRPLQAEVHGAPGLPGHAEGHRPAHGGPRVTVKSRRRIRRSCRVTVRVYVGGRTQRVEVQPGVSVKRAIVGT